MRRLRPGNRCSSAGSPPAGDQYSDIPVESWLMIESHQMAPRARASRICAATRDGEAATSASTVGCFVRLAIVDHQRRLIAPGTTMSCGLVTDLEARRVR
jgi:hypothetical protein